MPEWYITKSGQEPLDGTNFSAIDGTIATTKLHTLKTFVFRRGADSMRAVVSLYPLDLQKLSPETGPPRREHCHEFSERRNRFACYPRRCHRAPKIPCRRAPKFTASALSCRAIVSEYLSSVATAYSLHSPLVLYAHQVQLERDCLAHWTRSLIFLRGHYQKAGSARERHGCAS